jgi:hypothetical protein
MLIPQVGIFSCKELKLLNQHLVMISWLYA